MDPWRAGGSCQLAPYLGEVKKFGSQWRQSTSVLPGRRTLGSLSAGEAASLGYAGHQAGERVPPELGDATLRSAGRPTATRAIRVARGEPFSEVTDAPKTASYAIATHKAGAEEKTHNEMRLHELTHGPGGIPTPEEAHAHHHPGTGQQSWSYDEMYPGMRSTVLAAHQHDPTAEDYVMNAITTEKAHAQGKPPWKLREAMDIVGHGVRKGGAKNPVGAQMNPVEMLHAVNTAATHEAARRLGLTPVGTQAVAWTHFRRQLENADRQRETAKETRQPRAEGKQLSLFSDRRYRSQ